MAFTVGDRLLNVWECRRKEQVAFCDLFVRFCLGCLRSKTVHEQYVVSIVSKETNLFSLVQPPYACSKFEFKYWSSCT